MSFFSRLKLHEPLFRGMADRLGIDLGDWITRNPEHVGDYRGAVLSCTSCTHGAECTAWQADHPVAEWAPDYCRNRRMLQRIRP